MEPPKLRRNMSSHLKHEREPKISSKVVANNTQDTTISNNNKHKDSIKVDDFYKNIADGKLSKLVNLHRLKTDYVPLIVEDVNLDSQSDKEENSPDKQKSRTKEDIKTLYKTFGDQCLYEESIGNFKGCFATTFKNFKKENDDKIRISVNNPINSSTPSGSNGNSSDKNYFHSFAIYDGHFGSNTSKYLGDNVNVEINKGVDKLLNDPLSFISSVFSTLENNLQANAYKEYQENHTIEKSGSCAHLLININDKIYLANCGNSRAILSQKLGDKISQLSVDHCPSKLSEENRIKSFGGKIEKDTEGVLKVYPGGLRTSRSLGDFYIKSKKVNGNPGMISASPDIIELTEKEDMDFILMGSDSVYNKLSNKDIVYIILKTVKNSIDMNVSFRDVLVFIGENIVNQVIDAGERDNISLILLIFNNLYKCIQERDKDTISKALYNLKLNNNIGNELYKEYSKLKEGENESYYENLGKTSIRTFTSALEFNNEEKIRKGKVKKGEKCKSSQKKKISLKNFCANCFCFE